jgi:hypothetical protein
VWVLDTASITAGGNITINGQNAARNWGVAFHTTGTLQSSVGNIDITGFGTGGVFMRNVALVAANNVNSPASGGTISINGTGSSDYGFYKESGSLFSYGGITVNASSTGSRASYYGGAGSIKSVGGITLTNTSTSGYNWGTYVTDNQLIQSTTGNITITSSGQAGAYIYGRVVAADSESSPTTGGGITLNATGSNSFGLQLDTSSLIANGPIAITATNTSAEHAFQYLGASGAIKANGNITIQAGNTSGNTGNWGLTVYGGRTIQSTAGDVSITARGSSGGIWINDSTTSIVAGNSFTAPTAGGNLTITATGVGEEGIRLYGGGGLVANRDITITGTSTSSNGVRINGSQLLSANRNISITGTSASTTAWAQYFEGSRLIQSVGGNIDITANGGYGMYINGGGVVAGDNTTTPTGGGTVSIRSTTSGSHADGAGLRMDNINTKILAWDDINIYANAASAGMTGTSGNGHGILMWGSNQVIRSYNGDLTMTGYANRWVDTNAGTAGISGGITLYTSTDTLRAKGDVTLKGVSMQGIGLYLTVADGGSTTQGVRSDTGNIVMDGLNNNSSYGATYIRLPVVATAGSISISGAGGYNGIRQDAWQGSISASGDINLIGYARATDGLYFNVGSITSTGGSVTLSGYTPSTTTTDYGIYSNARAVTASNGSVIFQGAKINATGTGSTLFANAALNQTSGQIDPIFAVADPVNPAFGVSKGISWSGTVTANTSTGYIQINSKAPDITGNMTAYGLALLGNNQNYSLTGTGSSITALAASLGTGSLTYTNTGPLTIGAYGSIRGITAGTVTLTAAGLLGSENITTTGSGTITLNQASGSYEYSGGMSGGIALTKSGAGIQILSGANANTGTTTISAGTLKIVGTGSLGASTAAVINNSSLIFNTSNAFTYTGAFSGTGALTVASGGLTLNGGATYSGATVLSSLAAAPSSIAYNNNVPPSTTGFSGYGTVNIAPAANSRFTSAYTAGYTYANTLTGVTLGSTSNTQDITLGSTIVINGPISVYGGNITVNAGLTSNAAGQGIYLKGTGNITTAASTTLQTNGGDITLWSDSNADGGYIYIKDGTTLDSRTNINRTGLAISTATGGGTITLGGGSANTTLTSGTVVPTDYALNTGTTVPSGVMLGTASTSSRNANIKLYSGSGDVVVRGKSSGSAAWNTYAQGITSMEGLTIDAGQTGNITLVGESTAAVTYGSGMYLGMYSGGSAATLIRTNNGNIVLTGTSTGATNSNRGLLFLADVAKEFTIEATGTGSLTMNGSGANYDFLAYGINFLAKSGDITITDSGNGSLLTSTSTSTIGYKALSDVPLSTSNITVTDDSFALTAGKGLQVNTKGTVTIQSYSNSFTGTLSYPITDLTLSSDVSGLTIGKDTGSTAHTDTITLSGTTSIAGPVKVYGGTINVNANLSSTLTNAQILLKASGDITFASGVDITTQGGKQVFWSDSDASGSGSIISVNASSNLGFFTSNGGDIVMGGGAGTTVPTGAAYGLQGVNLSYATLNAGSTGDISLRGASSGGASYGLGLRLYVAANLTGRNITLVGQGATSSGTYANNWGIDLEGASIIGSGAISITGTGGGSGSTGNDNHGVFVYGSTVTGTGSGTLTITGTGGGKSGAGTNNDGVNVAGGSTLKTTSGTLTLIGTAGLNGSSEGIAFNDATTTLGDATTQLGGITLRANSLSFGTLATDHIVGKGSLSIEPLTANATLGIGTGSGVLTLANSLFSGSSRMFADGFSSIILGSANTGDITVGGANTFVDSVSLVSGSNITINSGATISDTQASGYLALAATGNFYNLATGTPLTATGRWLVYSNAPGTDTFGTLDSANAPVWNATYANMAPSAVAVTGNRYLFTGTPSVTVTAGGTKVYGTAWTTSDVLGLSSSSGSSSVYTLPTLADVFSVNPVVTSGGLAAAATVAGGPYAITVAPGTSNGSYNITYATPGTITVTRKVLTVTGSTAANKTYDGTLAAVLTGGVLNGVVNNEAITLVQAGSFATKDVGTGIGVTASDSITGATIANYTLTQPTGLSANITQKALTITANNDARFAGQTDTLGYYGVSYVGFVSGESSTNLTTQPTIARTNSSVGTAGVYNGVLVPSGAAATNYSFSYVNGNYTIVGANELLVRLGTVSNVYATTPTYSVTEAKYMLPNNGVVDLLNTGAGSASVSGAGQVTITDTSGASASFNAVARNGTYSTSGWLNVGTYQWAVNPASVVLSSGVNFNNTINVVGSQTVTTKFFAPTPTISKVYDSTTTIAALSGTPIGVVTGDVVQLGGAGAFADKNAGINKTYTLTNLALSGADAGNYGLSSGSTLTASNGTITAKAITVTGISANDKVYDGNNTATMNVSNAVFNGMVAGDALTVSATGTFGSANVAYSGSALAAQVVAFTSTYGGADVNNYTYAGSPTTTTTAKITPKSLTLTGAAANDKTYDGGVVATLSTYGSLTGVLAGDASYVSLDTTNASASFADKNVAYSGSTVISKTVTLLASSLGLSGNKAGNYAVVGNTTLSAKINPRVVTVSGITASNKVYDATTNATVSTASAVLTGKVAGDDLNVSATGVFASKNAGTASTVNLTRATPAQTKPTIR